MRMVLRGSDICTLGSQLVFGGSLGSETLLMEVCHWRQVLRGYNLAPLPLSSFCLLCVFKDVSPQLPALAATCCHVALSSKRFLILSKQKLDVKSPLLEFLRL